MKKIMASIIFGTIIFSFSTAVLANSGPVFWQGYPSSEIMAIDEDSPIMVKNENLIFDFSDDQGSDYTVSGRVKASYKMVNPTNELQSVQMAFPFVGTVGRILPDDIVITADGRVQPYNIYVGDEVENFGDPMQNDLEPIFAFDSIVNSLTDEIYIGQTFAEKQKGKLYTINVQPTAHQGINLMVDFNFDFNRTKILTKGFNRYERDDEKTKIASWCYKPETLEIFVLGEDIDLEISAFTDGQLKEKTDLFTYQVSKQEVEVESFLLENINKNSLRKSVGMVSDTQLYNLYAKKLDRYFSHHNGYCSWGDLTEQEQFKRILTLVYTVNFPRNSEQEVSVSYPTIGTMDKTKTVKPLYSFDYILNPARHWRDFRNLNIKIITPHHAPYLINSNIEFSQRESNVYTATLANLPENDLQFALYASEKLTLLDKVKGNLRLGVGFLTPFGILVIIVVAFIVFATRALKKHWN